MHLSPESQFQFEYATQPFVEEFASLGWRIRHCCQLGDSLEVATAKALEEEPSAADMVNISGRGSGFCVSLREDLAFGQWGVSSLFTTAGPYRSRLNLRNRSKAAFALSGHALCRLAGGWSSDSEIKDLFGSPIAPMLRFLRYNTGFVPGERRPVLARAESPCVVRLQHSSVYFYDGNHGVLSDPQFATVFNTKSAGSIGLQELGRIDAVLISDAREDHFYLSALAMVPRTTLIVVPKIARPSLFCPDMEQLLRELGFTNVISAEWNRTIQVGAISIAVLPMHGLQLAQAAADCSYEIRNHANTYLVSMADVTAWILSDSEADHLGSMMEVASDLRNRRVNVDLVLGSLQPVRLNKANLDWIGYSADRVEEIATGAPGLGARAPFIAEICKTLGARTFLPYGQGWGPVGGPADLGSMDEGGEDALLELLRGELEDIDAGTHVAEWRIGGAWTPSSHAACV